ncbi:MAG TPA: hypothetical protein V6D02_13400 [Candidatus Obscuribacterales bacterium]
MTLTAILDQAPELTANDYLVVGVATCFRRQEGELETVKVLEPVPSAYLESLLQGIPTAYEAIWGTTVGELLAATVEQGYGGIADVCRCDNFGDRIVAAARTYQSRPAAQALVPLGAQYTALNYSTEKKRVLNSAKVVKAEDNVKQHEYTHKKL